jgi:hypothetical protein
MDEQVIDPFHALHEELLTDGERVTLRTLVGIKGLHHFDTKVSAAQHACVVCVSPLGKDRFRMSRAAVQGAAAEREKSIFNLGLRENWGLRSINFLKPWLTACV